MSASQKSKSTKASHSPSYRSHSLKPQSKFRQNWSNLGEKSILGIIFSPVTFMLDCCCLSPIKQLIFFITSLVANPTKRAIKYTTISVIFGFLIVFVFISAFVFCLVAVYIFVESQDFGLNSLEVVEQRNIFKETIGLNVGKKGEYLVSNVLLKSESSIYTAIENSSRTIDPYVKEVLKVLEKEYFDMMWLR